MNTDLVEAKNNKVFTTSNKIGEEFGIAHNHVMEKITSFTTEISILDFTSMFEECTYTNNRLRAYKNYHLSRDGYMFLVMNISTKRAHDKKLAFIKAFNLMEEALRSKLTNESDLEWTQVRLIGKKARLEETDAIKEFVEYATKQGSTKAKFYYSHVTKATYKALGFLAQKNPQLRDTMNMYEVSQLMLAEKLAANKLKEYMSLQRHYKDIYESVKNDLIAYANAVRLN